MTKQEKIDLIDSYLTGAMDTDERDAFESLVGTDEELAELLERHRKAFAVIRYARYRKLRERLRRIDEKEPPQRSLFRKIPLVARIAVAAAVIIALAFAVQLWVKNAYSDQRIAEEMFAMTEPGVFRDGTVDQKEAQLKRAEELFFAEDYQQAENIYVDMIAVDDMYRPRAEWNLLLCYFIQGNESSFRALLSNIAGNPLHPFHRKARALQRKVSSPLFRLSR